MSAVPKLSQWSMFVKSLGGYVGLDMSWDERAWAEFADEAAGPIEVICRLAEGGDLDVTIRPTLEGEHIREHPRLPQALAALAYVNPASSGDGEPVSRDRHRGDWYQLNDELAVAVAGSSGVGGVEVGGRGAFLVYKGRLWLPHGEQEPRQAAPSKAASAEVGLEANGSAESARTGPVQGEARNGAAEGANGHETERERPADNTVAFPAPAARKRPAERRARIFGEEADDLIHQARSAGRHRA